jgi:hypothetical protein
MSVKVRLQRKLPDRELPQWATVSASKKPGSETSQPGFYNGDMVFEKSSGLDAAESLVCVAGTYGF